jgi:hypothetical protein
MGSAPKAPDPFKQAAAQRQENMWTSQYNTIGSNANQYTPYGSVTSSPGSKVPIYDEKGNVTGYGTQWNQTTSLSPQEQAIFDQEEKAKLQFGTLANQQLSNVSSTLANPFTTAGEQNWAAYGAAPDLRQDQAPTDRAAIEKAMMDSYTRGVQPQQSAEDAQMAARGMGSPGSKYGYNVSNQRSDAAAEQTRQAYLASGAESRSAQDAYNKVAQQTFLNKNAIADQSNWLRQAQTAEGEGVRTQNLNELSALMGGSQATIPSAPAFQGSQVNPFDIAGAINQQYQNKMTAYQNKMSGLFGIAGAGLQMLNPFKMFGAGTGLMG